MYDAEMMELTAAGLSGILTRFPFDSVLRETNVLKLSAAKVGKFFNMQTLPRQKILAECIDCLPQ